MNDNRQYPPGMTGEGGGQPHPFSRGRRDDAEIAAAMQVLAAQTRRDHAIADAMEELANLARGASILLASKLPEGTDPRDTQEFRSEAQPDPA